MSKKLLIICVFFCISLVKSQTLQFTYDSAGNQVKRELVTLSVNSILSTNSVEETEEESETMLPKSNSLNNNATIIEVYPNPVVDIVNIEWPNALEITELILFDNNGKLLQFKRVGKTSNSEMFDLGSYASGMYYIRLIDINKQSKSYKIIKK